MTISGIQGPFADNGDFDITGSTEVDPADVDLSDLQNVIDSQEEVSSHQVLGSHNRSIALVAGVAVMVLAITVAVVALTVLTAGIPQSILLGIALSTLVAGSITTIQNGLEMIHNKVKEKCMEDEKWRIAAHGLSLGAGLTSIGFAMKFGGTFVPGYGNVVGNMGSTAFTMGTNSAFNSLCYLLYMRLAASEKVLKAEPLTEEERMQENRKFAILAISVLTIGVGCIVLGISLAVVGSVALAGVPASVALVFAPPLLSIGVGLSLRALLRGELSKWKEYLKRSSYDLLEAEELANNSEEEKVFNKAEVFLEIPQQNKVSSRSKERKEGTAFESEAHSNQRADKVSLAASLDPTSEPLLSRKEKVSLALGSLLLIASLTLLLMSGVGGLAACQILIMSVVGSSLLGTAFGTVFSGLFTVAGRLKNRNRSGRSLRELAREKINAITGKKTGYYKVSSLDVDKMVASDINQTKKEKVINTMLVGGITFLLGVGIALLGLIPGVGPFSAALISIAGPFLITGGLLLIKRLIDWLNHQLYAYRKRAKERKERIRIATAALGVEPMDVYVDVEASLWAEDFRRGGSRRRFPDIALRMFDFGPVGFGSFGFAPFGIGSFSGFLSSTKDSGDEKSG